MIPSKLIDKAKQFITRDQPFGPTYSERIRDKAVADLLFDRENKLYRALDERPAIILGRRGSGKTAYLDSAYFLSPKDIIIEIRQEKLFERVLIAVERLVRTAVLTESVADVWFTLLMIVALQELVSHEKRLGTRLSVVRDYLAKLGVREGERADDTLWSIVDMLSERLKDKPVGIVAQAIKLIDNVTFDMAIAEATTALRKTGLQCVLLLDSLESYPFDIPNITHAVRGLLKCVGAFNSGDFPFESRFCLPAELYHTFVAISSAPLKDFERSITLHWHPKELLFIAAKRIALYLELYEPATYGTIQNLQPDKKQDALKIFYSIFPEEVQNRLGFDEGCLAYLLRHTQLLPRQLLRLLNSIAAVNRQLDQPFFKVRAEAVVKGVANEEQLIAAEIFSGFAARYHTAQKCCETCVPELPFTFDHGQLHKVFTRYGKKQFEKDDYDEFKRMLIEIGAVGRVIGKTELYVEGQFEYTEPHKLAVSVDDELCLHPIFAGAFSVKNGRQGLSKFTVYPYGANPEINDWRTITHGR